MIKPLMFCNNCGKDSHTYHQCNKPIISLGIIAFRKTLNKIEYLTICRKDSLGYIDFVRGKYPLHNIDYIQNIIDEMTNKEKYNIINHDFDYLWKNLWGGYTCIQYKNEEKKSREKFNVLKYGLKLYDNIYTLDYFISKSKTNWTQPEWGFPKGRRSMKEKDLQTALREFEEETGYNKNNINIIKNIISFEEIFTGSNLKSYKHKYYLGCMNLMTYNDNNFQKSEVSDLKWLSIKDILKHIRPYNIPRIKLIKNIDKLLYKYSLIL